MIYDYMLTQCGGLTISYGANDVWKDRGCCIAVDVGLLFGCSVGFLGVWSIMHPYFGHKPLKHKHQREPSHCGRTMGWCLSASAPVQWPLCEGRRHPPLRVCGHSWRRRVLLCWHGGPLTGWSTSLSWFGSFIGFKMTTYSVELRTAAAVGPSEGVGRFRMEITVGDDVDSGVEAIVAVDGWSWWMMEWRRRGVDWMCCWCWRVEGTMGMPMAPVVVN